MSTANTGMTLLRGNISTHISNLPCGTHHIRVVLYVLDTHQTKAMSNTYCTSGYQHMPYLSNRMMSLRKSTWVKIEKFSNKVQKTRPLLLPIMPCSITSFNTVTGACHLFDTVLTRSNTVYKATPWWVCSLVSANLHTYMFKARSLTVE